MKQPGIARINQAGWVESPILLTNTLSVGAVHDGVVRYIVNRYPNNNIVLPIVAECYDGGLNDISGLHVTPEHAIEAIENATSGPVAEGCVGGGTGMRCYGFKAGIGTASRVLPEAQGGWTVGVLVNSNGGRRSQLRIDGVPVGKGDYRCSTETGQRRILYHRYRDRCTTDASSIETVNDTGNTRTRSDRHTEYRW